MSRGYVYILINESMPNLVKIGMTTRSVDQRVSELFQTGVPTPFQIYAEYLCPDCAEVEQAVHASLDACRVSEDREFFVCPAEKAAVEVMNAQREQVEVWLDDFIPNQIIADSTYFICPSSVAESADKCGLEPMDMCFVLRDLTAEELAPAADRRRKWVDDRRTRMSIGLPLYGDTP